MTVCPEPSAQRMRSRRHTFQVRGGRRSAAGRPRATARGTVSIRRLARLIRRPPRETVGTAPRTVVRALPHTQSRVGRGEKRGVAEPSRVLRRSVNAACSEQLPARTVWSGPSMILSVPGRTRGRLCRNSCGSRSWVGGNGSRQPESRRDRSRDRVLAHAGPCRGATVGLARCNCAEPMHKGFAGSPMAFVDVRGRLI